MKPTRTQRLDSEFRRAISEIVAGPLKNREPALRGIISVTETDVAPDLKTAKVYVSILAAEESAKKEDFRILKENAGFVRHELSQMMRMRTVPQLTFIEDGSMEYGSKMDALLSGLDIKPDKDGE